MSSKIMAMAAQTVQDIESELGVEAMLGAWGESSTPVYCRDLSGRLLAANGAFFRKLGRPAAEAHGLTVGEFINPDDIETFHSAAPELSRPPHQATRVHRWLTPQGWRWISWEESVLFNRAGRPAAVRAVGHDITRQRLAEEMYFKLSRAVEQSPAAIVITDLEGRAQYINPKFTQISGYTLEDIIERNLSILREGHASDESYLRILGQVRAGGEWQGELMRRRSDGSIIWESVQLSCIRNIAGEITNFLCLREDITERKRLAEALRQAQKMESLGTLAGGIAHDFNNILAVINGYAEFSQLQTSEDPTLQKSLREIRRAAQRAAGLVRQILTFSRKADTHLVPLDLNHLVRELAVLLSETFPRTVTFSLDLPDLLPSLLADQNQIQQIMLNLCVNARDAMPDGGTIAISAATVPGSACAHLGAKRDKHYVCLKISDTGIGMTPEVRSRIFEPFFTTKQGAQGTGLGLAVVHGIVANHGGYIDVDSILGSGSSFKVYLPISETAAVAPALAQPYHFPEGAEPVLVVEDEEPLRNLLKTAFTNKGYRVSIAADGQEAIAWINDPAFVVEAVILDLNMPRANGLDVIRAINAIRPSLKVLVLSGYLTAEAKAELEQLGHKDCLQKPYSLEELGRRLRRLLDS